MRDLGGRVISRGTSAEGRPLTAYLLGPSVPGLGSAQLAGSAPASPPSVLLTGLLHGVELIGSMALLRSVEALCAAGVQRSVNLIIAPVMNPDALAHNCHRLSQGRIAWQRCNARGVDLNRNFGRVGAGRHWHPFSGSSHRVAPHYAGPGPFSEPESRWLAQLARDTLPKAALGFHSFGELLLYPWGHTSQPHPRAAEYRELAECFAAAQPRPYQVKQAHGFYPTHGDLDDWLDHELGTLALTVEVGNLSRRLLRPRLAINPFWWMNPIDVEATIDNVVPGVLAIAQHIGREQVALAQRGTRSPDSVAPGQRLRPVLALNACAQAAE